jgi:hypothetical protein
MRTLLPLEVPKNTDSKFPFNAIQNETDTQLGTPVVEEIYGDIVTNIYKLLQQVGITPTETQDSDTSQYQILQALQQLPNSLNDIEQVLSFDGVNWNVDLNFDLLPNKYFFFARASDNYYPTLLKGTSGQFYLNSDGFSGSDEILVVLDHSQCRAYSLSAFYGAKEEVFSVLGEPLSYNDSGKMYYQHEGKLFSNEPNIYDLQQRIRDEVSAITAVVLDMIVTETHVLCFCFDEPTLDYFFVQFPLNDLNTPTGVDITGTSFGSSVDYVPYVFAVNRGKEIYVSNSMNNSANDYSFSILHYEPNGSALVFNGTIDLDSSFEKTTNAVIKSDASFLYTFISGVLKKYDLSDGSLTNVTTFPSFVGRLISFKNEIYFLNGEVAKKWNL